MKNKIVMRGMISFLIIGIIVILSMTKMIDDLSFDYSNLVLNEPNGSDQSNISNQNVEINGFLLELLNEIEAQKNIDEEILNEFNQGNYTFESPFIILNPYNNSPLTALILFKTSNETKTKLIVNGKTTDTTFEYTYNNLTSTHIIPVYALYADYENQITLINIDSQGKEITEKYMIQTEKLDELLTENVFNVIENTSSKQPGLNFSYVNGNFNRTKTSFDSNGEYRWYYTKNINSVTNYTKGSFWTPCFSTQTQSIICEYNYLGKLLSVYDVPFEIHHDLEVNLNELLITSSDNAPKTIEDFILLLNLDTGKVEQFLEYRSILFRTRIFGVNYDIHDWMHMNSIDNIEEDVIVSSNWQSTILRNDWEGNIKWMLGNPSGYPNTYSKYFLKPIGANFEYPYNQHAVEVLNDLDNNLNTVDIIVFDNGSSRNAVDLELQRKISANLVVEPALYSRLVHYRINEVNMTVEQIWQYGKNRPELFSAYRGDADLLDNGNVLGTFDIEHTTGDNIIRNTTYVEVDSVGNVVWECWATSSNDVNVYLDYRLERMNIFNDESMIIDLNQNIRNFISNELIQKVNQFGASK